ncbi:MAG: hypothetical protein OXJ52_07310 [Oligoflexia bacterium]|nr:hypothetical protein [Oligoflexia bacterium]
MENWFYCFFILLFAFVSVGCDGIICENAEKSVVFNYNPLFQVVDIGGSPTYNKNALKSGWVKKLFVSETGFLALTAQKTVKMKEKGSCDKQKQNCLEHSIVSVYSLQTYRKEEGYKYWFDLKEQERLSLTDINSRLSRKPDFHASKCRFSPLAGLLDIILTAMRA